MTWRAAGGAFCAALAILLMAACGASSAPSRSPTPAASAQESPSPFSLIPCSETPGPPPAATPVMGNLFSNPGFESGCNPWFSIGTAAWGTPFPVSGARTHSGASSAYLGLRSQGGGAARVFGVVQEISPSEFPEVLSGNYYVANWMKGTPKQYLQFVVIVFNATNPPAAIAQLNVSNYQLRYILAGVDSPPFRIDNAHFVFLTKGELQTGTRVHFERNIRQDFQQLWGGTPQGFSKIRILFETRWDGRADTDGPSAADVYYDDLYVGPAPAP